MNRSHLTLMLVTLAGTAWAGGTGVTNEDRRPYTYEIQCGGSTSRGTFHPGHNAFSGSVEGCKLKVKGAGSATIHNRSSCTIKEGMLDCD